MKTLFSLISFMLFSFACFSQEQTNYNITVPQENGKVVFSDTIQTKLSKAEMQHLICNWLTESFLPKQTPISVDSIQGLISCRPIQYLEIEKKALYLFAIYMRYSFVFQFQDNRCIASIRNINFIEYENVRDSGGKYESDDLISAERIMIEKKYRRNFVSDACEKITKAAVDEIKSILDSAADVLEDN